MVWSSIFWFEELGLFDALAVKVAVSVGETHLRLGEHKREETVLVPPFGGCEMARKGRELLDEVSNGVGGGMPRNCVDWD